MIIQTSGENDEKFLIDFEGYHLVSYSFNCYSDHVEKKVFNNVSFEESTFKHYFLDYLYKSFDSIQNEYNKVMASYENADCWDFIEYEQDLKALNVVSQILFNKELNK